jgi:hypothetical protein
MGSVDTIKSKYPMRTKIKQLLPTCGEHFPTRYYPLDFVMLQPPFIGIVLGIFSYSIHDCMKVYMDEFTIYGDTFEEALANLGKVLKICKEANLSLSNEKCFMILTKGIFLGHHISPVGIRVDPTKI